MKFSRFLRIDLCSKIEQYMKKYAESHYIFDYKLIKVGVYSNQVFAGCNCNSPEASLLNHLNIYESKKFNSFYEARGHAESEIAGSMITFPSTRFILSAELPSGLYENCVYENGIKMDFDPSEKPIPDKLCHCGARFNGIVCPICGNWHL
jgi:hypothetical protein